MAEHHPAFDLVNIEPTFVLGRDETATDASGLIKGANAVLITPSLGHPAQMAYPGATVHVDDVATMHVRALSRSVPGNEDYLASSHGSTGIEWAAAFDIIKKRYPAECADGTFKVDTAERPQTAHLQIATAKAEKAFGITFKSFEDQVLDIAGQYLELIGSN